MRIEENLLVKLADVKFELQDNQIRSGLKYMVSNGKYGLAYSPVNGEDLALNLTPDYYRPSAPGSQARGLIQFRPMVLRLLIQRVILYQLRISALQSCS
jgi:hypothetical protein